MPEMRFTVRWPDEKVDSCYSPSLVIKDYLTPGQSYPVAEFVSRTREALTIASDRVKKKYGFHCTGASSQLMDIERSASKFAADPAATVKVLKFEE